MVAPARAADSLRKALAIGADRAVHVADDALAGSDLLATARALAKAVEREEPDLVLLGQQGSTPTAQSSGRRSPTCCGCRSSRRRRVSSSREGTATAKRQTEYGYDVIEAPLPAVVACPTRSTSPATPP